MATKKAGGTAKNLKDSNPQYLGVKLYAGEKAAPGAIIVRQRGTVYLPGRNTDLGKDDTIFATKAGIVAFKNKRKTDFTGKTVTRKEVEVK
jgi:large subunit ribosomal protein L27